MKRKIPSIFLAICLICVMSVPAFASSSATVNAGSYVTAFFSKTVTSDVDVDQLAAAWQGTEGSFRWVLALTGGYVEDVIYLEGAEFGTLETSSSGSAHRLRAYNDETFKMIIVYDYTVN